MATRKRNKSVNVYFSEEEYELIKSKFEESGSNNFSDYARKMLTTGTVVRKDYSELKLLTKELGNLARSINQIALRVNETRNIYEQDITDLQRYYANVKRACCERLVKMAEDTNDGVYENKGNKENT